jgi:probable phosphoglycerate mutase
MIYLFRHGQTMAIDGQRRFIGQTELPLSDVGRQQADRWRQALAGIVFDRIICSPLSRCRDTAAILARGRKVNPEVAEGLVEIHLGEWEGLAMTAVRQRYPEAWQQRGEWPDAYRPPGGESFSDVLDRAWPVFEELLAAAEANLAVVAHAGVNRALLCRLLGMPLANLFRLAQDPSALNLIDNCGTPARVAGLNLTLDRFQRRPRDTGD